MTASNATDSPRVLSRADHAISRKGIDGSALKVLTRLERARAKAFLVGGAVRDLLLELRPKDYDVATEARPNQVKRLFRNSRIIGRRFRLVHVYFQDTVVEVSTFRRGPDPDSQRSAPGELLITDDNVFGNPREDAFRRDFTINALFYTITDSSVVDYVGGIADLEAKKVRAIGDPHVRFQEDPVRMLRACEYAGRLGFTIESGTQEGVRAQRREIEKASPARLLDELIQLMRSTHSAATLQWMLELGLLEYVLPDVYKVIDGAPDRVAYQRIFGVLDALAASGRPLPDSAAIGALLLPGVSREIFDRGQGGRQLSAAARREVAAEHAYRFATRFRISKVRAESLTDAMLLARKMGESDWTDERRVRLSHRAVFDDALLLFELLTGVGDGNLAELEVWRRVAQGRRRAGVKSGRKKGPPRRRKRRSRSRRKKP